MIVIPPFDPTSARAGYIQVGSVDPGSKVLLYNLSVVNVLLNFDNGDSAILHAQEANYWILDGSTTSIEWSQYSMLNNSGAAISQVTGQVYRADEEVLGTYPMSVSYQTNIGNTVGTTVGGTIQASALVNTTAPVGTANVLQVADPTGPTLTMNNDGVLQLSTLIGGALKQLIKTQASGNPLLLGVNGLLAEVLGGLQVDGNASAANLATGNLSASGLITAGAISSNANPMLQLLNVPPLVQATVGQLYWSQPIAAGAGNLQVVSLFSVGFRNGNVGAVQLILPSAFQNGAIIIAGGFPALQYLLSGGVQNVSVLTTLSSTSGTTTSVATTGTNFIGFINSAFDTLSLSGSQASAHTGPMLIVGF